MHCIVLVGGIIGCGKTTFINYLCDHKNELFAHNFVLSNEKNLNGNKISEKESSKNCLNAFKLILDDVCSIKEQFELMQTIKGWRNFRVDLLMAAERYVCATCGLECNMAGPLSERSQTLLHKFENLNDFNTEKSDAVFLVEDNFYYRSMRYDWFQIARRANVGFCEVFLQCPIDSAIQRNSNRGYKIPEQKIQMMLSCMEYPNPSKHKWEKYSVIIDSLPTLDSPSLKSVIITIEKAAKNPAELMITEEKVKAQKICSKNAIHQADNILRKIISRKISLFKENILSEKELKTLISSAIDTRQEVFNNIRQGSIHLSSYLLEKLQNSGIESIQLEYEEFLNERFEKIWNERTLDINIKLAAMKIINVKNDS